MAFGDGKRLNPVTTGSQQGEAEGVLQTISASSDDFRLCLPDDGMQASVVTVTALRAAQPHPVDRTARLPLQDHPLS